jgi:nucleoside-diphosphate-sugar epimerase
MKILVTGGRGFLGSHFVDHALKSGQHVTVFDRKWDSEAWTELGWDAVDFFLGDLKDRESVFEAIRDCDRWINLGGLLGTSELIANPMPAVEVNIVGALNIFDAAATHKKPGLQIEVGNYWMNNPYSITKNTAARFAEMYREYRGLDVRIVRAMNVYGPRQKHRPVRKIFPNVVIPALHNLGITVYGNGEQIMDMIHVEDVCEILYRVLMADELPPITFEAGAGGITVNTLVASIMRHADSQSVVRRETMRAGEEEQAVVKISKEGWDNLAKHLSYDSCDQIDFEQGVKDTVQWYRENLAEFPWDES